MNIQQIIILVFSLFVLLGIIIYVIFVIPNNIKPKWNNTETEDIPHMNPLGD